MHGLLAIALAVVTLTHGANVGLAGGWLSRATGGKIKTPKVLTDWDQHRLGWGRPKEGGSSLGGPGGWSSPVRVNVVNRWTRPVNYQIYQGQKLVEARQLPVNGGIGYNYSVRNDDPPFRIRFENAQGAWRDVVLRDSTRCTFVTVGNAVEMTVN
jgi:hypothetical protein